MKVATDLFMMVEQKHFFYDDVLKSLLFLGYDAGYRHKLRKPEEKWFLYGCRALSDITLNFEKALK